MSDKAKVITLDIETYRTVNPVIVERIRDEAIAREYNTNTRKEEKLTWDSTISREKRAAEALDKTAIDVLLAELLCCCWLADTTEYQASLMPLSEDRTKDELESLAQLLDDQAGPETIWTGHHIEGFDFPVLLNAWRRYDVQPPDHFPKYRGRRWRGRVYDTMQHTPCSNGLNYVSLSAVCEAYGMGSAKDLVWKGAPMDGSRVAEAYDEGAYDVILEYCGRDVAKELELYLRQTCGGVWGTYDTHDEVAERIAEIRASDMPESAKKLSICDVMDQAGLIPRVA